MCRSYVSVSMSVLKMAYELMIVYEILSVCSECSVAM
jgi:hypothetical protein